jgi:hypothetical protein
MFEQKIKNMVVTKNLLSFEFFEIKTTNGGSK